MEEGRARGPGPASPPGGCGERGSQDACLWTWPEGPRAAVVGSSDNQDSRDEDHPGQMEQEQSLTQDTAEAVSSEQARGGDQRGARVAGAAVESLQSLSP